jgi:hypothetical protein
MSEQGMISSDCCVAERPAVHDVRTVDTRPDQRNSYNPNVLLTVYTSISVQ